MKNGKTKMGVKRNKFKALVFVIILVLASSMFVCCVSAGAPQIEWVKEYPIKLGFSAYSVQQTSDGGYIVLGDTRGVEVYSDGRVHCSCLIKIDPNGYEEWNKTFIGFFGYIQQTFDKGYIIIGSRDFYTIHPRISLLKTDKNGEIEWSKNLGYGIAFSGQQTFDGGYIVAGIKDFKIVILKTNEEGEEEWNRTLDGALCGNFTLLSPEYFPLILQIPNDGYIVTGTKMIIKDVRDDKISTTSDVWLIKMDREGNEERRKIFNISDNDYIHSIVLTSDGGYVIAGETEDLDRNILMIKTDSEINEEWIKTFNGSGGYECIQTSDYGYVVTGDNELIKIDSKGNEEWRKSLGDITCKSVQQTTNGGYIVAGGTWSPVLIKLTPKVTLTPPGFEAIFAIAGLLTVAYLLRRRK